MGALYGVDVAFRSATENETLDQKGPPTMIRFARIRTILAGLLVGAAVTLPGLQIAQSIAPQAAHAAGSGVDLTTFVGYWHNVDSGTTNITNMHVYFSTSYNADRVDVWGKCHPTDCYWGTATIVPDGTPTVLATYHFSFATKSLYMWRDGSLLRVYSFTHFTDHSGRKDYSVNNIFAPTT
jgi:hypothetical protein